MFVFNRLIAHPETDTLRNMTRTKHTSSRSASQFSWKSSVVLPLAVTLLGAAVYDWVKQPGVLAPVVVFATLSGSLAYSGLATAALARRASRLKKMSNLDAVRDAPSADFYLETLRSERTKGHLDALKRESTAASASIILLAVTIVAFIILAPWLFGA